MTDLAPGTMGADMRSLLPPVRDQGERGTCLAFAVTGAHEFARADGMPVTEHLSEEALHWGCKVVDGNWASGTRFSSAAVAIRATGQPVEASWPYDPNRADGSRYDPPTTPTADWYTSGLEPMSLNLDDLRAGIDGGRPVLLGLTVIDTFFVPTAAGRIEVPAGASPRRGGHAVVAVGHDPSALLIRNSWGSTWAVGGYAWLADEYIERYVRGAWVIDGSAGATTPPSGVPDVGEIYGAG